MLYVRLNDITADKNSMTRQSLSLLTGSPDDSGLECVVGRRGDEVIVLGAIVKEDSADIAERIVRTRFRDCGENPEIMDMKKSSLSLAIKQNNSEPVVLSRSPITLDAKRPGEFSGIAHNYHKVNVDQTFILSGAMAKSIKDNGDYPLLFEHQFDKVLGVVTPIDGPSALRVRGKLCLKKEGGAILNPDAWKLKELWDTGNVYREMSIHGMPVKFNYEKHRDYGIIKMVNELRLIEISIVNAGGNPGTRIDLSERESRSTTTFKVGRTADTPYREPSQARNDKLLADLKEMAKW